MNIRKQFKKFIYGTLPLTSGSFSYYGVKVYFPKDSLIFQMACDQGIYESHNLRLIIQNVSPNSVYFDVGANIGLMSVPILLAHPSCTVLSVEISPNSLPFLQRTIRESQFTDRWLCIDKAFSDKADTSDFYLSSSKLGAFDSLRASKIAQSNHKVSITTTTLDLEWQKRESPQVSFIKIDVEGAEFEVLQGASHCISVCRPYILVEWNAEWLKRFDCPPEKIFDFCNSFEYKVLNASNLTIVGSKTLLEMNMLYTESFLLVPEEKLKPC
jgi:FkbM family methyltransferase